MKYITGFVAFWYDFIVGDAWEVAVGVIVGLIVLGLVAPTSSAIHDYGALALPVLIAAVLAYSLWRVRDTA
ncbi:MAG: hypothetical protein M3Z04_00340 [Chloroflexota bacterium]|nr:hypothetical protein [Chloroflexota bacterium]